MKSLLAAVSFLTTLPAGRQEQFEPQRMLPWFPVVGLLLGLFLATADLLLLHVWPVMAASLLEVILLAALTGALHLDGVADTADGLYGQRTREKALAIMKDSRVGAMGLVAVLVVFCLKWSALAALDTHRFAALLLVPAYARGTMVLLMQALPYGRPEGGTGRDFFRSAIPRRANLGLLLPVGLSLLLGPRLVMLNLGFLLVTAALVFYYRRKIGCITGDMLGAACEITEALLFLALAMGAAS
jgi:adenosylcobinamide-GDP ribazoletransferase